MMDWVIEVVAGGGLGLDGWIGHMTARVMRGGREGGWEAREED